MIDYSLYLVTDSSIHKGRALLEIIAQSIQGGVSIVQIREKMLLQERFIKPCWLFKNYFCYKTPLIINDRLDIVLATQADGLHIGQNDIPYPIARKLLGKDKLIGLSVETLSQAKQANEFDLDYIAASPVFFTETKKDISHPLGLEGVKQIASFTHHKLIGIGGIDISNAKKVVEAGADGVAVVSQIINNKNPYKASKTLAAALKD